MVWGFRYDLEHASKYYPTDGIAFSCYAVRKKSEDPAIQHFCDGQLEANPSGDAIQEHQPIVYMSDLRPLNSLVLGRDAPPPNTFPIRLLGITDPPASSCTRTINHTAILTPLDSFNPFHNLLMLFRRLFAAIATISANVGGAGSMTDCTFAIWRGDSHEYGRFNAFDSAFLTSLCRGGAFQLTRRSGAVCFSSIILGATPGGWDMDLGPEKRGVRIHFAGVALARWLRARIAAPAAPPAPAAGAVLVLRRGRRELVNEDDVRRAVAGGLAPAPLGIVDFDSADLRTAFAAVAARLVMVGVHGAGLSNLIFLPPGAALVEIAIAPAKTEFYFLALSFGKLYFAHHALVPTDDHLPDPRDRRVTVDDVPALGRLAAHALAVATARLPSCC
jgi:hypothetical protein